MREVIMAGGAFNKITDHERLVGVLQYFTDAAHNGFYHYAS